MPTCKVDNQGRILIPSKWRVEQGVGAGSEVVVLEEDGRLILQTREQAVRDAQEMVRRVTRPGSLLTELQRDRRRQASREAGLGKRSRRGNG